MPRPGPRRKGIGIRISDAGIEAIDKRAEEDNVTRSEMARRLLAYGQMKMPKGWKPK